MMVMVVVMMMIEVELLIDIVKGYVLQRYVSYAIGYYTTCMHSTKEAVVRLTE